MFAKKRKKDIIVGTATGMGRWDSRLSGGPKTRVTQAKWFVCGNQVREVYLLSSRGVRMPRDKGKGQRGKGRL